METFLLQIVHVVKIVTAFCLSLLVLFGCGQGAGTLSNIDTYDTDSCFVGNKEYSKLIMLNTLDTIFCPSIDVSNKEFTVVCYFSGDCSQCIAKYIQWVKSMNSSLLGKKVDIIEITNSAEHQTLLYYMDEYHVQPIGCLLKSTQQFEECNEDVLEEGSVVLIYLLDKKNQIMVKGNPFADELIMEEYQSILQNEIL